MAKTPEGEARFARSYAAIGNVGILDGEDREFGIRLRENRINSQSIAMLKISLPAIGHSCPPLGSSWSLCS